MAIVKWVGNGGGGSGDTQASDYTIDEAIDYINGSWANSDHLELRLFEAITLAADPSAMTVSPTNSSQVIWNGWSGDATDGEYSNVDVNANGAADYIWRYNTSGIDPFEYMHWRYITAHGCSTGVGTPWEFTEKPIRNVTWINCHAHTNIYGWSFHATDDPHSYWKWLRCSGYSNTQKAWNLPSALE